MLVGTFSFTPDEANVDDLAKACELQQNLFCSMGILALCHIQSYTYQNYTYHRWQMSPGAKWFGT